MCAAAVPMSAFSTGLVFLFPVVVPCVCARPGVVDAASKGHPAARCYQVGQGGGVRDLRLPRHEVQVRNHVYLGCASVGIGVCIYMCCLGVCLDMPWYLPLLGSSCVVV